MIDTDMQLTVQTFIIVCPLLFLAGFVDAIGGGGGLISLPAYILAGLPVHNAIATNKLSTACGTFIATARFIKHRLISFRLALPSVIAAVIGAAIGARLSILADAHIMEYILFAVLPVAAFFVLNTHLFEDKVLPEFNFTRRTYIAASVVSFVLGVYDGFYGPGTGTFLIIAFTLFAKLSAGHANAQTKIINLSTNISALIIFLMSGHVMIILGLVASVFHMLGSYAGSGLAISKGTKIMRPIIMIVLGLLFLKLILEM